MSAEQIALKPCPFCGGDSLSCRGGRPYYVAHWVECDECLAEGPAADTEAEAIAAWNTRAQETPDAQ